MARAAARSSLSPTDGQPDGQPELVVADRSSQCAGRDLALYLRLEDMPSVRDGGSKEEISLVDCSVTQVLDACKEARMDNAFEFWKSVLTGKTDSAFHPFLNRLTSFWVKSFNNWQAIKRSKAGKRIVSVDGLELSQVLLLSHSTVRHVIGLFDREGHRLCVRERFNKRSMSQVIVSVPEVLVAGVLLSKLIPRHVKQQFLFGLFDVNGDGKLDASQFCMFLKALFGGLGAVFCVSEEAIPELEDARRLSSSFYELFQRELGSAPDDAYSFDQIWTCMFDVLPNKSPVAAIFYLLLKRCSPERCFVADCFDTELDSFQLNHSEPVQWRESQDRCRQHGAKTTLCKLLTPPLVAAAHLVFKKALERFDQSQVRAKDLPHHEVLKGTCVGASDEFGMELLQTLELVCDRCGQPAGFIQGVDFLAYLRLLCPCASKRHLRMYLGWCEEFDQLVETQVMAEMLADCSQKYAENSQKPCLPQEELTTILRLFKEVDRDGSGLITMDEMEYAWSGDKFEFPALVSGWFCARQDGYLTETDFIRMMCPPEFRLPQMTGFDRDTFGAILTNLTKDYRRHAMQQAAALNFTEGRVIEDTPSALLPAVPNEMLQRWTAAYQRIDADHNGTVSFSEIAQTSVVSNQVAEALTKLLDPEEPEELSLDSFLRALCDAYNYRMTETQLAAVKANYR